MDVSVIDAWYEDKGYVSFRVVVEAKDVLDRELVVTLTPGDMESALMAAVKADLKEIGAG